MASPVQASAGHRGRYVGPPNMIYKTDFDAGSRLLTGNGYDLPDPVHGMNPPQHYHQPHHHQFPGSVPRNFVSHYDVVNGGHHDGSSVRQQYQQRMNGSWPMQLLQPQQHQVYPTYHHQSFCGQNNDNTILQNDQVPVL